MKLSTLVFIAPLFSIASGRLIGDRSLVVATCTTVDDCQSIAGVDACNVPSCEETRDGFYCMLTSPCTTVAEPVCSVVDEVADCSAKTTTTKATPTTTVRDQCVDPNGSDVAEGDSCGDDCTICTSGTCVADTAGIINGDACYDGAISTTNKGTCLNGACVVPPPTTTAATKATTTTTEATTTGASTTTTKAPDTTTTTAACGKKNDGCDVNSDCCSNKCQAKGKDKVKTCN